MRESYRTFVSTKLFAPKDEPVNLRQLLQWQTTPNPNPPATVYLTEPQRQPPVIFVGV